VLRRAERSVRAVGVPEELSQRLLAHDVDRSPSECSAWPTVLLSAAAQVFVPVSHDNVASVHDGCRHVCGCGRC
jgi:hypothetical protein